MTIDLNLTTSVNLIPGKLYLVPNRITLFNTPVESNIPDSTELCMEKFVVMFISDRFVSVNDEADMKEYKVLYKDKILYCGYHVDIDWKQIL